MVAEGIEMMEVVEMHQVAKVEIHTCEDEVTFDHLLWRCQLVFVDDTSRPAIYNCAVGVCNSNLQVIEMFSYSSALLIVTQV
jgi:hypothetical protein